MTHRAAIWAPTRLPEPEPEPTPPIPEPTIRWIGSPNYSSGRSGMTVCAIVIHTMAGTLASCDSWFQNPAAQVSSQYGIGLAGQQHQYVALTNTAWANGILESGNRWPCVRSNPNPQTVSIETEDNGSGSTPVSEAQYQATLQVCHLVMQSLPSVRYLVSHRAISPSSRPSCCGDRWWGASQRFQNLALALGLEAIW